MNWLIKKASISDEQWERYKALDDNAKAFFMGRILGGMSPEEIEKHLEATEMSYRK